MTGLLIGQTDIPLDPIALWGSLGAVVVLLMFALMAWLRGWVVLGSLYKTCLEKLKEREAELQSERDKRETASKVNTERIDQLRDSLELRLQESNRLLLEATEAFQRMRRR